MKASCIIAFILLKHSVKVKMKPIHALAVLSVLLLAGCDTGQQTAALVAQTQNVIPQPHATTPPNIHKTQQPQHMHAAHGLAFVCKDNTSFQIAFAPNNKTANLWRNNNDKAVHLTNHGVAGGTEFGNGYITFRDYHGVTSLILGSTNKAHVTTCRKAVRNG